MKNLPFPGQHPDVYYLSALLLVFLPFLVVVIIVFVAAVVSLWVRDTILELIVIFLLVQKLEEPLAIQMEWWWWGGYK